MIQRPFIIVGPTRAKKPVPVGEDGRPLPPTDTDAHSFIACGDCAARELSQLCSSDCPRTKSMGPRLAIRKPKEED